MSLLKGFWGYLLVFVLLVLSLLAWAVWDSSQPNPPSLSATAKVVIPDSTEKALTKNDTAHEAVEAPGHFPAPAKKLHKLLSLGESGQQADTSLDQKIIALDKQLSEVSEALVSRGLDSLDSQATPETANTDPDRVGQRLQAIKDHMAAK